MLVVPGPVPGVVLDAKDILQDDATVVAGILVLLTILYALTPKKQDDLTPRKEDEGLEWISRARKEDEGVARAKRVLAMVMLSMTIPFSLSAIIVSGFFTGDTSEMLASFYTAKFFMVVDNWTLLCGTGFAWYQDIMEPQVVVR